MAGDRVRELVGKMAAEMVVDTAGLMGGRDGGINGWRDGRDMVSLTTFSVT